MPAPAMHRALVEIARRHTRVGHEAEDLAHDIIVSALRRGLALDDDAFLRSAHGAARLHAAFLARSAVRRRAREADAADSLRPRAIEPSERVFERAPPSTLSPALRTTLLLLCAGLAKAELRAALGIDDAALRKRFQALRERGPHARPAAIADDRAAHPRLRRAQVQLVPRLADRRVRDARTGRVLGVADPDGHGLIVVAGAALLTNGPGAATTVAPAPDAGRTQGRPC